MMLNFFLLLTSAGIANLVRRDTIRWKAVTLFSNTDIGSNDKEVTLYTNESILIATWTWKNGPIEVVNMNPDYIGRIDMDRSKNIWNFDVDVTDAGKYWIKCSGTNKVIEVELNILEKKLTEEEMKSWLDDHQGFIEKYLGNLTDEVGKEVSKWLEDHPGFFEKLFDISGFKELYFKIAIFVIVTLLLVHPLLKLLAEVCTMLKSSWCRKYLKLGTEEATTKCQCSHNSQLVRERGPQVDHCAYCGKGNSAMFVLPCEHEGSWYIPTCIKCGISRRPCKMCRAPNTRYVEFALWKNLADPVLTKILH